MPQIGATIEEMQQLHGIFAREATSVEQLTSTISGQVGSTWWVGPAAERFRGQWDGEFRPMLQQLQQSLQDCSREVQQRATAIEAAGS